MAPSLAPRARAFKYYIDARFDRLAGISNDHLYNIRQHLTLSTQTRFFRQNPSGLGQKFESSMGAPFDINPKSEKLLVVAWPLDCFSMN